MIPETATAALALNPFEKFAQTTKRDERDPYVMFNFDRMINFAAISIPGLALATTFFIGSDLYTADGLQEKFWADFVKSIFDQVQNFWKPINPRDRDSSALRFDRWTELGLSFDLISKKVLPDLVETPN